MILKLRRYKEGHSAHGNKEGVHSQVNRPKSGPGASMSVIQFQRLELGLKLMREPLVPIAIATLN